MKVLIRIMFIFLLFSQLQSAEVKNKVHVKVTNLRSSNGWVVCHLFKGEDGFPTKSKKAIMYINDFNLDDKVAEFVFENLEPGEYAFTVHHDENGNKKMDTNFLGIPNEGWACSNNATGFLGMAIPSFSSAKFTVDSNTIKQDIEINY